MLYWQAPAQLICCSLFEAFNPNHIVIVALMIRVPFTYEGSNFKPPHSNYLSMMMDAVAPHFKCASLSSMLFIAITVCLVLPQFFWTPHSYLHFLTFTNIPKVYLDTILVRHNHAYLYQTVSSMLFHLHFLHWFNNSLMLMFMLTAIEYMWWPSVLVSLLAGVTTNLYVTLLFESLFMGISGALAASLGIYIAYIISNWDYLMTNYFDTMIRSAIFSIFMLMLMLVSNNSKTTSLHFIAIGLGVLFGMAVLPRHVENATQNYLRMVFKVLSLIAIAVPLVIIVAT